MAIDYRGLGFGQQWFPDEEVVDETVINTNRPILDAYQRSPHRGFGDVTTPPYMFQDMTVDEERIPGRVQEELPTKKGFQFPNFGITGILQGLAGANTPEENFARDYFKDSMDSSGRIYNNAEDLFGGKIPVSAFGKGMSAAGQKRIDTLNATLAKWEADKEKYAKQLRTTTLYDRRNKFQKQLDSYNRDLASAGAVTNVTNPNIERTTGGPDMNIRSFDPGLARAMGSYDRRAGPMGGPGYGPFSRAEGGRIGYANGEFVDEDVNIQGPGFDVNENIEMSSGGGEEDILEQLVAKYIEAGFPPEQAQAMAMQELQQMVAQSGQGEGIASLV